MWRNVTTGGLLFVCGLAASVLVTAPQHQLSDITSLQSSLSQSAQPFFAAETTSAVVAPANITVTSDSIGALSTYTQAEMDQRMAGLLFHVRWLMAQNKPTIRHSGGGGGGSSNSTLRRQVNALQIQVDALAAATSSSVSSTGLATTSIDTSAELLAILSDETGTGNTVFSASPTFTGTLTAANANFNGNVGIGTTTPLAKLSIDASAANLTPLSIKTNGSAGNYTAANSGIFVYDDAGTELFRIWASDPDVINNYNAGNLYIGNKAGFSQPTNNVSAGNRNTGVGFEALYSNTTGLSNSAFGYKALRANTTGLNNAGFGIEALQNNLDGYGNSAFGGAALNSNVDGFTNSAIGYGALYYNTSGDDNTAVGNAALFYQTTGNKNTVLGRLSGLNISNNIAQYRIIDDTDMVLIGYGATKNNAATLTNGIAIGSGAHVLQSNQVVLGNDNITSTLLKGNVGIGTSTPNQALSVFKNGADAAIELSAASGSAYKWSFGIDYSDGAKFKISSSSALGTNDRFIIDGNGNIGIGLTPSNRGRLQVATTRTETAGFFTGSEITIAANPSGNSTAINNGLSIYAESQAGNIRNMAGINGILSGAFHNGSGVLTNLDAVYAYTDNYGQVTNVTGVSAEGYNSGVITNQKFFEVTDLANFGTVTNTYGVYVGDITSGTQTNTPYSVYASDPNARNYFAGSVGIGTTSPWKKLSVTGDVSITGALFDTSGDAGTSGQVLLSSVSGTNWTSTSSLGINSSLSNDSVTPNHVKVAGQTDEYCLTYESTGTTFEWQPCNSTNVFTDGGSTTYLTSSDNLGVGTTTANQKLTVEGNINLSAATGALYFDDIKFLYASASNHALVFGESAGSTITAAGTYNIFMGYEAGRYASSTNVDYNNLVGYRAGYYNNRVGNNIIGREAGYRNDGFENNLMGYQTGYQNTGNYNNIFGYIAGYQNTGSYNNIIGYGAGYTNTGDNNIVIGYQAADNMTSGNNNIIIGHDIDNVTATADNSLNIGNLIFANGLDGTGTSLSSGNVGIGTTTPAQRLQVAGNIRIGTSGSNGCLENFGGGLIAGTCSSDATLKTDVIALEESERSFLEGLTALTPVTYKWNERAGELYQKNTDMPNTGLIAQDVEVHFPELVSFNDDGFRQIDFGALQFYVIEALKELWENVKGQDERIKDLEQENTTLKERLDIIENELNLETPDSAPPTAEIVPDEEDVSGETETDTATTTESSIPEVESVEPPFEETADIVEEPTYVLVPGVSE